MAENPASETAGSDSLMLVGFNAADAPASDLLFIHGAADTPTGARDDIAESAPDGPPSPAWIIDPASDSFGIFNLDGNELNLGAPNFSSAAPFAFDEHYTDVASPAINYDGVFLEPAIAAATPAPASGGSAPPIFTSFLILASPIPASNSFAAIDHTDVGTAPAMQTVTATAVLADAYLSTVSIPLVGLDHGLAHPSGGAVVTDGVSSNGATGGQVQLALDETGVNVNGSGIRVGVLSDSFNNLGGAPVDETNGALPLTADINVIKDLPSGGTDEGRAMMQIIHDVAPGANLAFYTAFEGEQDFANGILALAAAGCKVIVDDVSYSDEPFFQNGVIAQAIQTVEAEGVTYVTAAGNDASNGYAAAWTPISGTYDGQPLSDAESFSGNLVETITVNTEGTGVAIPLVLEWNQAYGNAKSNLELVIFNSQGKVVATATNLSNGEPGNPYVEYDFTNSGTYHVAVENLSGPDPTLIKEITEGDGLPAMIGGANAGTVVGHAMTPGAITAGAVSVADTPAYDVSPAASESFSSSGTGTELLFANNGTPLSSPDVLNPVVVSGVDGVATTVTGGLSDFYGTSAASASLAGVVAILLSENPSLTPSVVEQILEDTALSMSNSAVSGAGLAQIAPAVADGAVSCMTAGIDSALHISAGVTGIADTILTNGSEIDYGTAISTTVDSGGTQYVEGGGTLTNTVVESGGSQVVLANGAASGTALFGNEYIIASGVATGTTVESGGYQFNSGTASGTTVDSGGYQFDYGTAMSTTLLGYQYIYGTATGTTVGNEGYQIDYGAAVGTTVESGGSQYAGASGTLTNALIENGGFQVVFAEGTANGTTLFGEQYIYASGSSSGANVESGGYQFDYGIASGTTVEGSGYQFDYAGTVSGTTVESGGYQFDYGGVVNNTTVESGGYQLAYITVSGTTVESGGYQFDFGIATGTTVETGGFQIDYGTATGGTLLGTQYIYGTGTANGATVENGGYQIDYAAASGTTVDNGGSQYAASGGFLTSTVVESGGYQVLFAGGTASGATISGEQYIYSNGTATGTIVESGGSQIVYGTATNTTLSGGSATIEATGTLSGTMTFGGSGVLTLEHSTGTNNFTLVGFTATSDKLDLADVTYSAHTTATFLESNGGTGGTLTVSDGVHIATVKLSGNYQNSTFTLSSDGAGGTLVVDPPKGNISSQLSTSMGGDAFYFKPEYTSLTAPSVESPAVMKTLFEQTQSATHTLDAMSPELYANSTWHDSFVFTDHSVLSEVIVPDPHAAVAAAAAHPLLIG